MDVMVNMNTYVKVKLTERGKQILKERHEELNNHIRLRGGKGLEPHSIDLDEEGYYRTQLWILMSQFSGQVNVAIEAPFEMNIIIEDALPMKEASKEER